MSPDQIIAFCNDIDRQLQADSGFAWTYRASQHLKNVRDLIAVVRVQIVDLSAMEQTILSLKIQLATTEDELKKEKEKTKKK